MTASQNHGLLFEDMIIRSITGYSKFEYQTLLPNGYTSKMDVVKGIHCDHDLSIKVVGRGNSIGCGDALRFYDQCLSSPFIMVVGLWDQIDPQTKRYEEIHEIRFDPMYFEDIWGDIRRDDLEDFIRYIKSIPEGRDAQRKHRSIWKHKKERLFDTSNRHIIKINPKIDSKKQRRVQCTLNIDQLTNIGIPINIYRTSFRGIRLPHDQESTPRAF